jgi:hypothetical protein
MISILLQFIPLTLAAVTPTMVLFVIALLPTRQGLLKASAVVIGRLIAHLMIAFALVFLVGQHHEERERSREASLLPYLYLVVGLVLLALAVRALLHHEDPDRQQSRVAAFFNSVGPLTLGLVNFGIVAVSLRLLALVATGAAIITEADVGDLEELIATVILACAMVWSMVVPLAVYVGLGDRGPEKIEQLRRWMVRSHRAINVTVLTLFGAMLMAKGIGGL